MLLLKVHSHRLLKLCLLGSKRKLQPPACQVRLDFPLWSAVQGSCSSLAPCKSVIRVLCQVIEPTAFLVHSVLAAVAEDAVAVHSSAHGNSPDLCRRSRPVPQIMIFVFPAFTQSFLSIASFQVKILLTHSSSDSAMITRSLA